MGFPSRPSFGHTVQSLGSRRPRDRATARPQNDGACGDREGDPEPARPTSPRPLREDAPRGRQRRSETARRTRTAAGRERGGGQHEPNHANSSCQASQSTICNFRFMLVSFRPAHRATVASPCAKLLRFPSLVERTDSPARTSRTCLPNTAISPTKFALPLSNGGRFSSAEKAAFPRRTAYGVFGDRVAVAFRRASKPASPVATDLRELFGGPRDGDQKAWP